MEGRKQLMFMGSYDHTIDTKGRLIIPAKFREQLGEAFVITKGNDGCLAIYTNKAWETFMEKITQMPMNKNARIYVRSIVSSAVEVETDNQGRILVPQKLRAYAELEKEVVLAGAIDKVEIWNKNNYEELMDGEDIDDITEEMAELGLSI